MCELLHCHCIVAVDEFYASVSLALKVNSTLNAMWWTLRDISGPKPTSLWMTSFNERIAPSSMLSKATSYGYQITVCLLLAERLVLKLLLLAFFWFVAPIIVKFGKEEAAPNVLLTANVENFGGYLWNSGPKNP